MDKIRSFDMGFWILLLGIFSIFWGWIGLLLGLKEFSSSGLYDSGIGLIGVGVGFVAVSLSLKTDKLVKSIADLNFDEKIAAIKGYSKEFNRHKIEDKNEIKKGLDRLYWDLKAVSHLKKYASKEQKTELSDTVEAAIYPPRIDPDDEDLYDIDDDIENLIENIKKFIDPYDYKAPAIESISIMEKKGSLTDNQKMIELQIAQFAVTMMIAVAAFFYITFPDEWPYWLRGGISIGSGIVFAIIIAFMFEKKYIKS